MVIFHQTYFHFLLPLIFQKHHFFNVPLRNMPLTKLRHVINCKIYCDFRYVKMQKQNNMLSFSPNSLLRIDTIWVRT